jgi:hypothetical protein
MSFLRPIQWYHSKADPIWPEGTFKPEQSLEFLSISKKQAETYYLFFSLTKQAGFAHVQKIPI